MMGPMRGIALSLCVLALPICAANRLSVTVIDAKTGAPVTDLNVTHPRDGSDHFTDQHRHPLVAGHNRVAA